MLQTYINEHQVCPSIDAWLSEKFTDEHKTLYVTLLDTRTQSEGVEFPVNFEALWPMLGYARKSTAKSALLRLCEVRRDYILLQNTMQQTHEGSGGGNREAIFLTITAAQVFALQAGTPESRTIAEFFIATMEYLQDYHLLSLHYDKKLEGLNAAEAAFTSMLKKGKNIMYFGDLGVIGTPKKHTIKVGYTDDGPTRIKTLKYGFPSGFRLIHILEHPDNKELEARFKKHSNVLSRQRDIITDNGQKYTECYAVDEGMTVEGYKKLLGQVAQGLKDHVQTGWTHEERMKEMELQKTRLELQMKLIDVVRDSDDSMVSRLETLLKAMHLSDEAPRNPPPSPIRDESRDEEPEEPAATEQEDAVEEPVAEEPAATGNALLRFLKSSHVKYRDGACTRMEAVRQRFMQALGVPIGKQLNRGLFKEADGRYAFKALSICRSCRADDNRGGACCNDYRRTTTAAVKNLELVAGVTETLRG